jgi:Fur family ferric uptake transcriptional regulator
MLGERHRDLYRQFEVVFEGEGLDRIDERLVVLEAFLGKENHLTAAELTVMLGKKGHSFSEDFVTENLRLFSQYGFADEKVFADRVSRYEHRHLGQHHDHLICVRCGVILEFYNREIELLQTQVARRMGFHDLQHKMEIYGLCSNCLRKREPTIPLAMAAPGEVVRIAGFLGGRGMERRLTSMGLHQGAQVEIINSSGPGPIIVASRQTRIALGHGMASQILVSAKRRPQ